MDAKIEPIEFPMLSGFSCWTEKGKALGINLASGREHEYGFNKTAVMGGVSRNAFLFGAAGSGKTQLLRKIASMCEDDGGIDEPLNGDRISSISYTVRIMGIDLTVSIKNQNGKRIKRSYSCMMPGNPSAQVTCRDRWAAIDETERFMLGAMFISAETISFNEAINRIIEMNMQENFNEFLKKTGGRRDVMVLREIQSSWAHKVRIHERIEKPEEAMSSWEKLMARLFCVLLKTKACSIALVDEFPSFMFPEQADYVTGLIFGSCNQALIATRDTKMCSNDILRPDCNFMMRNDGSAVAFCDLLDKDIQHAHNMEKLFPEFAKAAGIYREAYDANKEEKLGG